MQGFGWAWAAIDDTQHPNISGIKKPVFIVDLVASSPSPGSYSWFAKLVEQHPIISTLLYGEFLGYPPQEHLLVQRDI